LALPSPPAGEGGIASAMTDEGSLCAIMRRTVLYKQSQT
jgi:hypothetical protein